MHILAPSENRQSDLYGGYNYRAQRALSTVRKTILIVPDSRPRNQTPHRHRLRHRPPTTDHRPTSPAPSIYLNNLISTKLETMLTRTQIISSTIHQHNKPLSYAIRGDDNEVKIRGRVTSGAPPDGLDRVSKTLFTYTTNKSSE
ncbi:hypothetical protein J6590_012218 [Homalodisca vitripennis]|nr:hypothetical protein J6590_012218 [Homalodisca vitripennis]